MRILSSILFSTLFFSAAFAEQDKPTSVPPANSPVEKAITAAQNKQTAAKAPVEKTVGENSLGLTVTSGILARGIDENKNPVGPGTEFAADGNRVFCITQIKGAMEPVKIEHRWYKDEVLISTIELPIKSLNWRTQSYKTIPSTMAGKWKVDVVLMPGEEVLTSLTFAAK